MCQMCERQIQTARLHLTDLIDEYLEVDKHIEDDNIVASQDDRAAALSAKLTHGVSDYNGVLNGQIAAVAVQALATKSLAIQVDSDQVVLVALQANERLRAKGLATVSTEAVHEILSTLSELV